MSPGPAAHLLPQRRKLPPHVRLPRLAQRALAPRRKQLLPQAARLCEGAAGGSKGLALGGANEPGQAWSRDLPRGQSGGGLHACMQGDADA
jgi:hypothetical protein